MTVPHFDWAAVATRLLLEHGFEPNFSKPALNELSAIPESLPSPKTPTEDLRSLLWSSIDNADSKDLDQIEYAETLPNGDIRVLVGVADVDARVPQGTAIDQRASQNTTSVYTGVMVFPMLPEKLSTDLTSCNQDADRFAIIAEYIVQPTGDLGAYRA